MLTSYDTSFTTTLDFTTETGRVEFVKSVVTFLSPKSRITLNTRNIYKADGTALKELLKVSGMLMEAKRSPSNDQPLSSKPLDLSKHLPKIKSARSLASAITDKGAQLYDLLGQELDLRDHRRQIISRPFELSTIESTVNTSISALETKLSQTLQTLDQMIADEQNLYSKISKKSQDFERAQKRLKSLQSVRPAYMDEYEKIESDLIIIYKEYLERFRNLAYLEQQLDEHVREEQDKYEETESSMKRMQDRLRQEELSLLRGETDDPTEIRPNRPNAAGSRNRVDEDSLTESDSEEEDQEDQISIDSDISSDEINQGFESQDIPQQRDRPKRAGSVRKAMKMEEDEDEESSIDIGDEDEEFDENDF